MSEYSDPLGTCRGCMFALVFEVALAAFILSVIAILWTLGYW